MIDEEERFVKKEMSVTVTTERRMLDVGERGSNV
jgi:hypothetical protein